VLAALLILSWTAAAQDTEHPEAVARLQLDAPAAGHFILHGTIPIPKGLYPRPDHKSPFSVQNHDPALSLVPAQVEIVSRYPTGEADVVEIFAPVDLAPEDHAGSPVSFSIVASENTLDRAPKVTPKVAKLLSRQRHGTFGLRARDVYGNQYWADLSGNAADTPTANFRVLKNGPWVRVRRIYATMVPIGDPSQEGPPLPHLLGVHAYITERTGLNEVELDLRLNNGATSGSRAPTPLESTLGLVYWRGIQLVLPAGWAAYSDVADPFLGGAHTEGKGADAVTVVQLVKPYSDGHLHMMGPGAQFERRLVLSPEQPPKPPPPPVPPAKPAKTIGAKPKPTPPPANVPASATPHVDPARFDPGLAFSQAGPNLWSWFEPTTARYFPQRDLLAHLPFVRGKGVTGALAIRARAAKELADLREGLSSGQPKGYSVTAAAMGWAQPWWVKEAGSPGGEGIATFEGYYAVAAAARENLDYLSLLHRMNVCRQPQAAYDAAGDPVVASAWLDAEGKLPFSFRLGGGTVLPPFLLPCRHGPEASEQAREVVRRGLRPPYDLGDPYEPDGTWPDSADCLLAWSPHDDAHYVRYTKQPKALVWLANDPMAKDDLLLAAELFRMERTELPRAASAAPAGRSLLDLEEIAKEHPHQGLPVGREDAWGIDAMCAVYSVASEEWRAKNFAWFERESQLLLDGAMSSGLVQRIPGDPLLGHARYAATQTFESLLLVHAMRCLNESVFRGVDDAKRAELEKLALRGIDYLFFGPPWARVANSWQPYPARPSLFLQGPRQAIAVAPNDDYRSPPFCDQSPEFLPADGLGLGVEWFHPWGALSYAEEISDSTAGKGLENRYLKRAIDCGRPHKNWRELVQDFAEQASDPSYDNSANWIGFLGKLESLERRPAPEPQRPDESK
jgi:hypothetical protein